MFLAIFIKMQGKITSLEIIERNISEVRPSLFLFIAVEVGKATQDTLIICFTSGIFKLSNPFLIIPVKMNHTVAYRINRPKLIPSYVTILFHPILVQD